MVAEPGRDRKDDTIMSNVQNNAFMDLNSTVSFGGGGGGRSSGSRGRKERRDNRPPAKSNNAVLCAAGTALGGGIAAYAPHPAAKGVGIALGSVTAATVCRWP